MPDESPNQASPSRSLLPRLAKSRLPFKLYSLVKNEKAQLQRQTHSGRHICHEPIETVSGSCEFGEDFC